MRLLALLCAMTIASATLTGPVLAQAPPSAPTTHILAIGRRTEAGAGPDRLALMPSEVRATVKLYLAGKIDQWYVRQDGQGVVFILNTANLDEARAELEALPLGRAKMMTFDLIPLGPLTPLRYLAEASH
jgi:hypothetical protein